ncbi:MAG TPA: VanZ family protein [Salinivirgaceae bacterium]|nr:VanZ family protein [Salinivirgaceae bacterium]
MKLVFSAISLMWMFIVTLLSLADFSSTQVSLFPNTDKVIHFLMYAMMTIFFLSRLQLENGLTEGLVLTIAISSAIIFGGTIELLQEFYSLTRTASIGDFFANALGSVVAAFAYHRWLWGPIQKNYVLSVQQSSTQK